MTKRCNEFEGDWVAYLDGELEPARERALARHLERCEACRLEVRALEQAAELLDEFEVPAMAPGIEARVRARLAGERGRDRTPRLRLWLRRSVAAAAALLVGFSVWWLSGARGPEASSGAHQVRLGDRSAVVSAGDQRPLPGAQDTLEAIALAKRAELPGQGGVDEQATSQPELMAGDEALVEEAIAALDALEELEAVGDVEMVEALDLLEVLEEVEDPVWLLEPAGESG